MPFQVYFGPEAQEAARAARKAHKRTVRFRWAGWVVAGCVGILEALRSL